MERVSIVLMVLTQTLLQNVHADATLDPVTPLWPCYSIYKLPPVQDSPFQFRYLSSRLAQDPDWNPASPPLNCVFTLEGAPNSRLMLQVYNVLLQTPGNINTVDTNSSCRFGTIRVYTYTTSGGLQVVDKICDSVEKGHSVLSDGNSAVLTSTVDKGQFDLQVTVLSLHSAKQLDDSNHSNSNNTKETPLTIPNSQNRRGILSHVSKRTQIPVQTSSNRDPDEQAHTMPSIPRDDGRLTTSIPILKQDRNDGTASDIISHTSKWTDIPVNRDPEDRGQTTPNLQHGDGIITDATPITKQVKQGDKHNDFVTTEQTFNQADPQLAVVQVNDNQIPDKTGYYFVEGDDNTNDSATKFNPQNSTKPGEDHIPNSYTNSSGVIEDEFYNEII